MVLGDLLAARRVLVESLPLPGVVIVNLKVRQDERHSASPRFALPPQPSLLQTWRRLQRSPRATLDFFRRHRLLLEPHGLDGLLVATTKRGPTSYQGPAGRRTFTQSPARALSIFSAWSGAQLPLPRTVWRCRMYWRSVCFDPDGVNCTFASGSWSWYSWMAVSTASASLPSSPPVPRPRDFRLICAMQYCVAVEEALASLRCSSWVSDDFLSPPPQLTTRRTISVIPVTAVGCRR